MALTQVTGPYPIFTDLDGTPLDDGYLYIGEVNDDPEQNPIQVFWDANLTIQASQPIRTNNGYAYRNGTPALIYTAGAFSITIRNKREEFVLYSPVGYGFDPAAVSASVVQNDFTGDGVTVAFTLSASPSTKLATSVFINGVYQEKDSYSVSGNTLTFTVAPPLSAGIEVMTNETGVIGSTNASLVSYTAGFAGAVAQTVQTKLEQYVSVKDFGAVGDGVTDDTAAIQDAINQANVIGGDVLFEELTYITSTLLPKSNVTLQLNGATLKLKSGTNERIFSGGAGGVNFAVLNGTLDGNQTNNAGNFNLSGASNFINWDGLTFKNVVWQNVFRASLILDGTTKNVVLENITHNNCGQVNAFGLFAYALECYAGTSLITIKNFTVRDHYGFGIHFFGATDFEADNLVFDNLNYSTVAIAITWTEAKRGVVRNVSCTDVTGDNLECNNSTDQLIENVTVTNAGNRPVLMGDNGPGTFNERVVWRNVTTTATGGTFSAALNYIKNCTFEHFQTDKTWTTLASGAPGTGDRNNVISDSLIAGDITGVFTLYRKFHIKRVRFDNFYVNDHDGVVSTFTNPQVSGSFNISLANGATTYVDFDAFNDMGTMGFVNGRLRVTAGFNNQQGTYHECLFLGSNNNTTFNLSSITTVINAVARTMTIAADAANRRISITNSTGNDVLVWWAVELHKADY